MISRTSIGTRLTLAFGIIVMILCGITLLSISRQASLYDDVDLVVRDRYSKVVLGTRALDGIQDAATTMRGLVIAEDPAQVQAERARLKARDTEALATLREFEGRITTDKGRAGMKAVMAARERYEADQARFLALLSAGNKPEATRLLLGPLSTSHAAYMELVQNMNRLGGELMEKSAVQAGQTYASGRTLTLVLAGAGLALAVAMAYWLRRSITLPLREAVDIANTIAAGNLSRRIVATTDDETGQLLRALATMSDSLSGIVRDVRANADAISGSAGEIAHSSLDLSSRTEEQASSLEETASSMEELTSTVRQSADNAQEASRIARAAADVAARGSAEVAQVVERMGDISESSRRIGDITGVIDGIAFQTNILALNAAVEAARAGEQGPGFAVVASEVRNLAQRSAAAAKEIKALIEESAGKVAAGNRYAGEAGRTMTAVLAEIERVSTLMIEIGNTSREQSDGIDQVNQAVIAMDQVTQQNAALVEQAARSAEAMQGRTQDLLAAVGRFSMERA
ncbi:methyl-accepting chemotaxis protein [Pseudoduganella lutea]|uniref:HAMP domain-containing protein n=1 Tax=Pseudoduganella lutea TaxID=321985 RepID=A0A4P6KSR1_9BURK|nr:methyl-accepting chemotaxis protein [Pseudoduganella lutea]QBE61737.1 HAMP domain-containing protein [Pseudoduganella lutea]